MNNNRRALSLALLLPVALAACAETGAAAPADGALVPTPSASRITGVVDLNQWGDDFDPATHRASIAARFWETARGPLSQRCATSAVAGCAVRRCGRGAQAETAPAPAEARTDVGMVTLSGLPGGDVRFSRWNPDPDTTILRPWRLWAGDERVTLRASEADPGASPVELGLAAPTPVALTSAPPAGARVASGVGGYDVAWTGGGDGTVRVQLDHRDHGGESVRVQCDFPASAGRAAVPAAAFAQVAAPALVEVAVMSVATARHRSDELDLTLTLSHTARVEIVTVE